MLATIKQCKGKVMLSGYPNELYYRELVNWNHHDFEIGNKVSPVKTKPIKVERCDNLLSRCLGAVHGRGRLLPSGVPIPEVLFPLDVTYGRCQRRITQPLAVAGP